MFKITFFFPFPKTLEISDFTSLHVNTTWHTFCLLPNPGNPTSLVSAISFPSLQRPTVESPWPFASTITAINSFPLFPSSVRWPHYSQNATCKTKVDPIIPYMFPLAFITKATLLGRAHCCFCNLTLPVCPGSSSSLMWSYALFSNLKGGEVLPSTAPGLIILFYANPLIFMCLALSILCMCLWLCVYVCWAAWGKDLCLVIF